MKFLVVFFLIFENRTFVPHTSILTKNIILVTLKVKYQNDPNEMKKCHMFQVIKIFQTRAMSKYFLTTSNKHTVYNLQELPNKQVEAVGIVNIFGDCEHTRSISPNLVSETAQTLNSTIHLVISNIFLKNRSSQDNFIDLINF